MLKIYYNEFYESHPYVSLSKESPVLGVKYCGDEQLLQLLMLHGGVIPPIVSDVRRQVEYCNHMRTRSLPENLTKSFRIDPLSVSNTLLKWRDTLVCAGWNLQSGESGILKLLRDMEPADLSKGKADCWREVLEKSAYISMLPENSEIIVTQKETDIPPAVRKILRNLILHSVKVSYEEDKNEITTDLGHLKSLVSSDEKKKLKLQKDGTLKIWRFDNEDQAIKYMVSTKSHAWDLWLCQQPKRLDNILHFFGHPAIGSEISSCQPPVVKLFTIGNSLFERPLNLNRILMWLESPITPLNRKLSHSLAKAVANSGGIENEEWKTVIETHLEMAANEKERKAEENKIRIFLPFLPSLENKDGKIVLNEVINFNKSLRQWATGLLAMTEFPMEDIVRDQLRKINQYCEMLLLMLESYPADEITFLELFNYCQSISGNETYTQYKAETGCCQTIFREGNIHSESRSLAWFCICDGSSDSYPFDFLTDEEFARLEEEGVLLYDRGHVARRRNRAIERTLSKARSLTIVETKKINGKSVKRHPLMIQLEAAFGNQLEDITEYPVLSPSLLAETDIVNNENPSVIMELEPGISIPQRNLPESYTSIDSLIYHPFDYVCRYLARLTDIPHLTVKDVNRTMGNVAHKMIEMAFGDESKSIKPLSEENYISLFNEAVNQVGLLLRQPENILELKELQHGMRQALKGIAEFISFNGLRVIACEKSFDIQEWITGLRLGSRADLLLEEKDGTKVVLDFKWTSNKKKYKEIIKTNTDLQFAIYKWLASRQYDVNVKTAYVLLPSVQIITADCFIGVKSLQRDNHPSGYNTLQMAEKGCRFRLSQFEKGKIERAEGFPLEMSEYGLCQQHGMLPLKTGKHNTIYDSWDNFKKLR